MASLGRYVQISSVFHLSYFIPWRTSHAVLGGRPLHRLSLCLTAWGLSSMPRRPTACCPGMPLARPHSGPGEHCLRTKLWAVSISRVSRTALESSMDLPFAEQSIGGVIRAPIRDSGDRNLARVLAGDSGRLAHCGSLLGGAAACRPQADGAPPGRYAIRQGGRAAHSVAESKKSGQNCCFQSCGKEKMSCGG